MVLYKDGKIYLKIVYWGMGGSGKTTILKTLYRITKESKKDIVPVGELQIIEKASGATLYFDRGLFQSTKQREVFYRTYTIPGQKAFTPLRKKIFVKKNDKTDAVIFVVDSRIKSLEDNIESLMELKEMANDRLIKEIPMIVMLNKQDLDDIIDEKEFIAILKKEKLWFDSGNELSLWNPLIYTSCAIYEQKKDVYLSFRECARRAVLYHVYGEGKAPKEVDIYQENQ